ncbi:MAG: GLUG motif-containing protein [Planctomycetota bacterium]
MNRMEMSNLTGKFAILFVICCCSLSAQGKYGGGSGTSNDPYQIRDANHMQAIGADANDWNKHFKLMADVDLGQFTGTEFNIIGIGFKHPFAGIFDGNGHTIANFTYATNDKDCIGLFQDVTGGNAEIKNLGLIDPNVNAGTGDYVGSLVGINAGTVTGCYVEEGSVSGARRVGGLVGRNYATITNCYANCYVSGNEYVGGLAGDDFWSTITNCYSIGSVEGTNYSGGLVGGSNIGWIMNSFWNIETSGQTTSAGGRGKTTTEMQTAGTFVGWGGSPVWTIDEGVDYPRLLWEGRPGELITNPYPPYGGGTGQPNDPYLIYTAQQLNNIGSILSDWDKHFKLMADIDLSAYTSTEFNIIGRGRYECLPPPIGTCQLVTTPFTGVFDGNGHTISNFTYEFIDNEFIGLFGCVDGDNAQIKNLGLRDVDIDVYQSGGYLYYGDTGSLIGLLSEGTVVGCSINGSVTGYDYVSVGGLVAVNKYRGTISRCFSTCNVSGWDCGGLVGGNGGTISNCYSAGSVSGGEYYVGGLVGYNSGSASVTDSFWDVNTSGQDYSDGGVGKTTAQMQTESTFTDAGWDFVGETVNGPNDIWDICEGTNYPKLVWQIPPGDFVCPDGVNFFDFSFFSEQWARKNCAASNDCDGRDFDQLGSVDIKDLRIFVDNWLRGF